MSFFILYAGKITICRLPISSCFAILELNIGKTCLFCRFNVLVRWPVLHVEIGTRQAIANRIFQLCDEHHITPNGLANLSGVPQSTINSILNGKSRHPGAITIRKICDGLSITLGEFFNTPEFDNLEQEIK